MRGKGVFDNRETLRGSPTDVTAVATATVARARSTTAITKTIAVSRRATQIESVVIELSMPTGAQAEDSYKICY